MLHPVRLFHPQTPPLGGCTCPFPTLESSLFCRGGEKDLSWERRDTLKPTPAPKGCVPGPPSPENITSPPPSITSCHLPFWGDFLIGAR